jgi:hypothetical protein
MEDVRITVRGSLNPYLKAAAARRHLSVSAFVTSVLCEYLRTCGELGSVTLPEASRPNIVSPIDESLKAEVLAKFSYDLEDTEDEEPDDLAAFT